MNIGKCKKSWALNDEHVTRVLNISRIKPIFSVQKQPPFLFYTITIIYILLKAASDMPSVWTVYALILLK